MQSPLKRPIAADSILLVGAIEFPKEIKENYPGVNRNASTALTPFCPQTHPFFVQMDRTTGRTLTSPSSRLHPCPEVGCASVEYPHLVGDDPETRDGQARIEVLLIVQAISSRRIGVASTSSPLGTLTPGSTSASEWKEEGEAQSGPVSRDRGCRFRIPPISLQMRSQFALRSFQYWYRTRTRHPRGLDRPVHALGIPESSIVPHRKCR